jgi:hypothetical protein
MLTGAGIAGLVAAAGTLSKPAEKLVEVLAAGCGQLYEPVAIRRRARAEGDALVIMEEARARASEVSVRAAQRLLDTAERQQENIEAIAQIALDQLPDEVSSESVDPDWATRYFREAQDVGNAGMQQAWGRLLAREVAQPGSFSPRTLTLLASLSRFEAELFEKVCSITLGALGSRFSCWDAAHQEFLYQQWGMRFLDIKRLQAAGLVDIDHLVFHLSTVADPSALQADANLVYLARPNGGGKLAVGTLQLTPSANELARIVHWERNTQYLKFAVANLRGQAWEVTPHKVSARPGGELFLEPISDAEAERTGDPKAP